VGFTFPRSGPPALYTRVSPAHRNLFFARRSAPAAVTSALMTCDKACFRGPAAKLTRIAQGFPKLFDGRWKLIHG